MQTMEFIELDCQVSNPARSEGLLARARAGSGKDYDILIMFLGPGTMDKLGSWIRANVLNFPLALSLVSNDI